MQGGGMGEGPFRGIVMPCDTCLGAGELITLHGPARRGNCTDCQGSGHVRIECRPEEVESVVARLPPNRARRQVHRALADAGLCVACFGAGVVASVDCDENEVPVRYLDAPCPMCSAPR
jgi:hypothetical protein